MRFVLRMAAREVRASWKRLAFFFIAMAIGVAAIVALRSLIQNVRAGIARESRALIAADLILRTNRPWTDEARALVAKRLAKAGAVERTESVETTTMVRPEAESSAVATMVELRALQPEFPFYGDLVLHEGGRYRHALLEGGGALVRPELLARLGVEVGDGIVIGKQAFTIRGVIAKEPGRGLGMFRLGPRVLIDYADLEKTGIIRFGSRVRYQMLLKVEEGAIEPLVKRLRQDFKGRFVGVRSFRETEDRVGRRLARAENYLSLTGFVILILGGIGVWSVVRVFVQQKLKSVAVLKCLGASARQIVATYVFQVLGLGVAGSLLGVGLARAVLEIVVSGKLGLGLEGVSYRLTGSAVAQGMGTGLLIALLFSLVPLLEVRRVKPLLLLRPAAMEPFRGSRTPPRLRTIWRPEARTELVAGVSVLAGLLGLAAWQAGSLRVGAFVLGGFAAVALVLHLVGGALVGTVRPLARQRSFALRHAVINVSRPGNQTRVILLAVGLGAFFILTIRAIETNLLGQFAIELREDAPDMFLLDIQSDQKQPLRALVRSLGARDVQLVPVLRARVTAVRGRRLSLEGYEAVRKHGWLAREFVVTYRDRLEDNEKVVAGSFWDPTPSKAPEVSIEDSFLDDFGIDVGDTLRFDILGRIVTARVTSLREVEWSDSRNGGFMIVFRPGLLEQAPHTFLGFLKGPGDARARGRFQRDLVARFPNVSIVDLRDILDTLHAVIGKVSLAVSMVGAVALLSGGLILVGSVAMTRFQRRYETAIFRTLGASKRHVASMMLLEYGVLGALAGVVGAVGAELMTWVLSRHVLEIPWEPAIGPNGVGIVAAGLGVSAVGLVVTLDVLRHKPLSILRVE